MTLQEMAQWVERYNPSRICVTSGDRGAYVSMGDALGSIAIPMRSVEKAEGAVAVLTNPLSLVLAANGIEP